MKKSIISVVIVCAACLGAAKFDWKQLGDLYKAGSYAELENSAVSMKADASNDIRKAKLVESVLLARQKLGKYASSDAMLKDADALAKEFGVSSSFDFVQAAKMQVLYLRREHQKAVEVSASWKGPRAMLRRAIALTALSRYADASTVFAESNAPGAKVSAVKAAIKANLPEKVYEYGFAAFSTGEVKDAATAIEIVNYVIDANYSGTTVTPAKVKEFLQTVNRKYSRKLVVNAPTKWDTLIQLVRQTLETY